LPSALGIATRMAVLVALSVLAQRLVALDDESVADVMRGPLDVLLMFETPWCEANVKNTPDMAGQSLPKGLIGRGWPEPGAG
jgi:hypothetical protein